MGRYIAKRFGQAVLVLFLVSLFTYFLLYMMPGDPVYAMLGGDITQEQYDMAYAQMRLSDPVIVRYVRWLGDFITGQWGTSFKYSEPVLGLIAVRLPVTMYLGVLSIIISTLLGILFGVVCGAKTGKGGRFHINHLCQFRGGDAGLLDGGFGNVYFFFEIGLAAHPRLYDAHRGSGLELKTVCAAAHCPVHRRDRRYDPPDALRNAGCDPSGLHPDGPVQRAYRRPGYLAARF